MTLKKYRTGRSPSMIKGTLVAGAVVLGAASQQTSASCGSAFCTVNTSWNVRGVQTEPGLRFDLQFQYIDQDQPRSGSGRVAVGQVPMDHDEVKTINRNWIASVDYAMDDKWGVSVVAPLVDRSHTHIDNDQAPPVSESWSFTKLGDVRVLGRRQWRSESLEAQRLDYFGITFGLKLPTGETKVENADGELAERSLQAGTGTTDLLLGAYFQRVLGSGTSWFADVRMQQALNSYENYKPGTQVSLDVGLRREIGDRFSVMIQLNALHKDRDSGSEAEPEDSGGKFLFVSPGLSYAIATNFQIYGFVQLPLYQYVNGVQLTANWAAMAGISARF
jgi:hypothetical protein